SSLANNIIRIWNPATRQYATYDGITGANGGSNIISSGQGFFVQSAGAGSMIFTENAKIVNQPPVLIMSTPTDHGHVISDKIAACFIKTVSATQKTELRAVLGRKDTPFEIGSVVVFQDGRSENFVSGEDVPYLRGEDVFLSSLSDDNKRLVINYMPQISD